MKVPKLNKTIVSKTMPIGSVQSAISKPKHRVTSTLNFNSRDTAQSYSSPNGTCDTSWQAVTSDVMKPMALGSLGGVTNNFTQKIRALWCDMRVWDTITCTCLVFVHDPNNVCMCARVAYAEMQFCFCFEQLL